MSNLKNFLFTSDSVSEGHPDKVSDRISDMVVDSFLSGDPFSRVACETLTTTNKVVLAGEVRGPEIKKDDLIQKDSDCIKDIGYDQDGFTWRESTKIESHLHSQSADIAMGVDSSGNKDEGAGDQSIMFGYACNETDVLMPAPIHYSHKILRLMAEDRKSGKLKNIEPDSKSQVTFEYVDGKPTKVKSVVISSQHSADVNQAQVRDLLRPYMLQSIPSNFLEGFNEEEFYVNPTGNFVIGGPDGDCGLTGRKIIVDTYGGAAPHGGGAFSGKDPTKVDRSAAYAARYIAKNVVASKIADKCLIQLAYVIGVSKPLSLYANTHGTGTINNARLQDALAQSMNLTPRGIRQHLSLNAPIYAATAAYGHFGRVAGEAGPGSFSWEATDLVDDLRSALA